MDNDLTDNHELNSLYDQIQSFMVTQAIYTAAKFKIPNHLQFQSKSTVELSSQTGIAEHHLYRLLRALATIDLFEEEKGRVFSLTKKGRLLLSDTQGSLYAFAIRCGEEKYMAWSEFSNGFKSDTSPFELYYEQPYFAWLNQNPAKEALFNQAMESHTYRSINAIVEHIDTSRFTKVMDVGGGTGGLLSAILQKNPQLIGVLFELEGVIDQAKKTIPQDLCERIIFETGDFTQSIPQGADCHIFKFIVHDWPEDQVIQVLQRSRESIDENGLVYIIETIIPEGNLPHESKWFDLDMFCLFNSAERTRSEYNFLLRQAGYQVGRIINLPRNGLVSLNIIECACL